ncbi:MAG: ATP-binding protein [Allosphingosinicella sp.]|uniref:ATP-binding protein n=1 Tax=Allosphingosinicella sp. TaxID=2823234 RepID=UPI003937C7B5
MSPLSRLMPRSLIGQIALVIALVLLLLQALNFANVNNERARFNQAQLEGPVITRFVAGLARASERGWERPVVNRRGRIVIANESHVAPEATDPDLASRLRETAAANGLQLRDARAAISDELPPAPPFRSDGTPRTPESERERAERFRSLLLSVQLPDGRWVNGQMQILRPNPWPLIRLAGGTLLLYVVLLAALILVLSRLIRPLRDLTRAAQLYKGQGTPPQVEVRGPSDIRRAIEAFNAMGARVGSLIVEKDRMLGAIGHDLRTPLASMRIRAESMEPADERERMIATIEEMTLLLDDTLDLARSGQSKERPRAIDVSALVDAVVEELRELGQPVTFSNGERVVASLRPNLIRRAVRNLADNAVKYAGSAEVSVGTRGEQVVIEIRDRGSGIPKDQLKTVLEPFVRLEQSRSRETGGSGLGLTLARAAALVHGGDLELSNAADGGLVARIVLPRG